MLTKCRWSQTRTRTPAPISTRTTRIISTCDSCPRGLPGDIRPTTCMVVKSMPTAPYGCTGVLRWVNHSIGLMSTQPVSVSDFTVALLLAADWYCPACTRAVTFRMPPISPTVTPCCNTFMLGALGALFFN